MSPLLPAHQGSGESTLATAVVAELTGRGHKSVLMPMDGFHLDDRILELLGLLPHKGAPETFDFGGFITAIRRVREESSAFLPEFDRSRETAIAAAEEFRPETRVIVVEGNYLVLDEDPWRALQQFWDLTVFLEVSIDELVRRLIDRWFSYGFDPKAAAT